MWQPLREDQTPRGVVLTNAHTCMNEPRRMSTTEPAGGDNDRPDPHESTPLPPLPRVDLSDYQGAGELLRALAAPPRLAIIDVLADGPRCVHEIVEALGISQPLVSQHLKTLRAARLVTTQRRGREMSYRIADDHVAHVARDTLLHSREQPPKPR